jgi:hypothetical protein
MPKYVNRARDSQRWQIDSTGTPGRLAESCGVLQKLGPQVQWVESFVTDDKVYCAYITPNEDARQGGFSANRISVVRSVIGPTTAEG